MFPDGGNVVVVEREVIKVGEVLVVLGDQG